MVTTERSQLVDVVLNSDELEAVRLEAATSLVESGDDVSEVVCAVITAVAQVDSFPEFSRLLVNSEPHRLAVLEFGPVGAEEYEGMALVLSEFGIFPDLVEQAVDKLLAHFPNDEADCVSARIHGVRVLSGLKDVRALPFLVELLLDETLKDRNHLGERIKDSIDKFGEAAEIALVTKMLSFASKSGWDSSPDRELVGRLTRDDRYDLKEKHKGPKSADAIKRLIPLLRHDNPFVSEAAAEILWSAGPRAEPALEDLHALLSPVLDEDDEKFETQCLAVKALCAIGIPADKYFEELWAFEDDEIYDFSEFWPPRQSFFLQRSREVASNQTNRAYERQQRMCFKVFLAHDNPQTTDAIVALVGSEAIFTLGCCVFDTLQKRLGKEGLVARCRTDLERLTKSGVRDDVRTKACELLGD